MEGGYYYDLFRFFNDHHNLILVDTEIQDIIHAVEKFNADKREDAQREADWQLEEDEDFELTDDDDCPACSGFKGQHMRGCPEDYSPFAELQRNGYD